ncbi:MAG: DNA-directed RNA polymerase subunit beta [bacterium]|nr:DNA-directed RNA polymerase subunit beta [bacterium]
MKKFTYERRHSFSKIPQVLELPDLLETQLKSYREFLQADVPIANRKPMGLEKIFRSIFPIEDNRGEAILEYVSYTVEPPKFTIDECKERGATYSSTLKVKLRLTTQDEATGGPGETVEESVFLGAIPLMTESGTFIINGAERVVVNQLHRSPGVSFSESLHPNGTIIYSGRIIPFRGSWIEFATDINDSLYAYIDKRKKFPVTTLLRALGYERKIDILNIFELVEDLYVEREIEYLKEHKRTVSHIVASDIVNTETGELLAREGDTVTNELLEKCLTNKIKKIPIFKSARNNVRNLALEIVQNTLKRDRSTDRRSALEIIYRELRGSEPQDETAAEKNLHRFFFDEKRYDLGTVGRYRLNRQLELNIPLTKTVLTNEDIVSIIKRVLQLRLGRENTDDIDHLGNRRVRTVGEQLSNQFVVALSRMARTVKERMNIRDSEKMRPQDLVNVRTVSSVINTFFGTNQLSQFMDQVNPLTELTHKRRLSALGPGGLTRERAGFEVRDVHYSHYGRLCPIETPEGPNIGLISSLCTYARINDLGFIETPYRKVVDGVVTDEVVYLSADEEDKYLIAQANTPIDKNGRIAVDRVQARFRGDFPVVKPTDVQYMDVAPHQMLSIAAALIPFLEHDDANRALMGSNMQRQAVPLLIPEAPIVGTGMEERAAKDSRSLVLSKHDGVVIEVDANGITIETSVKHKRSIVKRQEYYPLKKFRRTNQDTCINQKPRVKVGQVVKKGDLLADGPATDYGELALGRNILCAFMPWNGFNFEDSIIISERLLQDDTFTSVHIIEKELSVRETKRGQEELTSEIPNVSEEATKDLDENGIIRVGAQVFPNDILIGKVTPKGEMDLTPEDKLLKAIFGDKAGDVKDASLKAEAGLYGVVIGSDLFSKKKKDASAKREDKHKLDEIEERKNRELSLLKRSAEDKLLSLLNGVVLNKGIRSLSGDYAVRPNTKFSKNTLDTINIDELDIDFPWCDDDDLFSKIQEIISDYREDVQAIDIEAKHEMHRIKLGEELPTGVLQLAKVRIAQRRKISVGDKMAGRHGNKGVVGKIVPIEDMPFLEDGTPIDIILNPLGVPSRMNLGQIFETALGWVGYETKTQFKSPVFDGATIEDIEKLMQDTFGRTTSKVTLYDGQSGLPFDQKVMVGYIYMMKLSHLVDDKIHARSIGPYSLITQQPLGGKAQFGGQRFGEMEVWALEAYGAAHVLQEIMTVKSDDVTGRSKMYESIVKGTESPRPGIPESFEVLVNELNGLCLEVELSND